MPRIPFISLLPSIVLGRTINFPYRDKPHLTQYILRVEGFNQNPLPFCTILITPNKRKAFETVPRYIFSNKIMKTNMHTTYKKWLINSIAGRFNQTTKGNIVSSSRPLTNCVLQGSYSPSCSTFPTPCRSTYQSQHLW